MKRSAIFSVILSIFILTQGYAQKTDVKITNIKVSYYNEYVSIAYDIANAAPSDTFSIALEVYKKPNVKLNAVSLIGDVNNDISAGSGKQIKWNARKDGYILDDEVFVKVIAQPKIFISTAQHALCSAVMPGLGDYRIRNGHWYFLCSMAAYGSAGSAIVLNRKAAASYNNYLSSMDIAQRNAHYNTFKQQQQISWLCAGTAIALWAFDVYGVIRKSNKLNKKITPENSRYYYALSQHSISANSDIVHLNTKSPYELAMEKGNRLFNDAKYDEAIKAYEFASTLNPSSSEPKVKIDEVKKVVAAIKEKEDSYKRTIAMADKLYRNTYLERAKDTYNEALQYKPNDIYAQTQIQDINNRLEEKRIEHEYEVAVKNGDDAFKHSQCDIAIIYYNKALQQKPSALELNLKIEECKQCIADKLAIRIPLVAIGNSKLIKVKLNGVLEFDFILDTGADNLLISNDIFWTFWKAGIIKKEDLLELQNISIADGSSVVGLKFIMREIQIGSIVLKNVEASVIAHANSDCLLGGSAFKRLGKIQIDYDNNVLIIEQ